MVKRRRKRQYLSYSGALLHDYEFPPDTVVDYLDLLIHFLYVILERQRYHSWLPFWIIPVQFLERNHSKKGGKLSRLLGPGSSPP